MFGCLGSLIKCFFGLILIVIMLIAAYKLVHDPYRPEDFQHKTKEVSYTQKEANPSSREYNPTLSKTESNYKVPVQTGKNHDYIMENTFQKRWVNMELTPSLEKGLVYVIKVFKSQFGEDFAPTIISAHDHPENHEKYSLHNSGCAVDINLADLPYYPRRKVVRILEKTLPDDYQVIWKSQGTEAEHLHFQSNR